VPERALPVPLVLSPLVVVAGGVEVVPDPVPFAAAVPVEPDVLVPRTLMASPPTVTGTDAPAGACVPPAAPFEPLVVNGALVCDAVEGVVAPPELPEVPEVPRTLIASPLTATGTDADTGACVPEATPS
jgi:hypothetical protein